MAYGPIPSQNDTLFYHQWTNEYMSDTFISSECVNGYTVCTDYQRWIREWVYATVSVYATVTQQWISGWKCVILAHLQWVNVCKAGLFVWHISPQGKS